jgi:hypothetical protein
MESDRYKSLSPDAILATLRSLPRRYRAELSGDPSLDTAALASTRGREGVSPAGLIRDAAARISVLADAVHRAAVLDTPTVDVEPAVTGDPASIDQALAELDAAVTHAAQVIESQPSSAWDRRARVNTSQPTVLELAQDCAREGVEHLRRLTSLLDELAPGRRRGDTDS